MSHHTRRVGPSLGLVVSTLECSLTQRLPPRIPRGSRAVQLYPWPTMWPLPDATVTPQTTRTCAPYPGARSGRAQLIRAVCGPAAPINRPRGIPYLSTVPFTALSLSLSSPSPHCAPREDHTPPPPHAVTGADTGRTAPPSTGDPASPPEQTPVSSFAPKSPCFHRSIASYTRAFVRVFLR